MFYLQGARSTHSHDNNPPSFCFFKGENIEWLQNNKVIGNKKEPTLIQDAQKVETDSFSCNASNLVSYMTSDPVIQKCYVPSEYYLSKCMDYD